MNILPYFTYHVWNGEVLWRFKMLQVGNRRSSCFSLTRVNVIEENYV